MRDLGFYLSITLIHAVTLVPAKDGFACVPRLAPLCIADSPVCYTTKTFYILVDKASIMCSYSSVKMNL